jgi:asparaginyl-tRNA synthetase
MTPEQKKAEAEARKAAGLAKKAEAEAKKKAEAEAKKDQPAGDAPAAKADAAPADAPKPEAPKPEAAPAPKKISVKQLRDFKLVPLCERLRAVLDSNFARVTYTEAVELLLASNVEFEVEPYWGIDLGSEHERWLAEQHFKRPVICYNYPKDFKAFYMRLNEDKKTVAAMDILVPGMGELIGGSQREERLDVLLDRLKEKGLPEEPYSWYLDTRRYGTVTHSGFGLGFERLVCFATGIDNIRESIPFPRFKGHADF